MLGNLGENNPPPTVDKNFRRTPPHSRQNFQNNPPQSTKKIWEFFDDFSFKTQFFAGSGCALAENFFSKVLKRIFLRIF